MGTATWNARTLLAAAGTTAIALGVLFAAEAITRPAAPAPTPDTAPEALAAKLEGWAADLRSQTGARP